jgi:putative ABC transport system permease protein
MHFVRQSIALVNIALASTRDRLGSAAMISVGIGSAIGVLVSTLSVGYGIEMMAMKNVRSDRAIVRSPGDLNTGIARESVRTIEALPGIKRDSDGKPVISADLTIVAQVRSKKDGAKAGVSIVGVGLKYQKVYPEIRIVDGRAFQPGNNELIVGKDAQRSFRNLELGNQLRYQGVTWTVVGTFEVNGGLAESWLLTDAEALRSAFKRGGFAQMTVVLDSSNSFGVLANALRKDPQLNVDLVSETSVRRQESRSLSGVVNFVSYFLGSIMAFGAAMGALNSMYTMVDARRRDFATLRAMGFDSAAIALAVVAEALLLAVPGALAGVFLPWLLFNGSAVSFVGLNFSLAVTPYLALCGILWALLIGAVGSLVPALRAARIPIAAGLRAE